MGVVVKEYNCKAHGLFETANSPPMCPRGCNAVERVFIQPPAVRTSGRTKNIDKTLEDLAGQFGLTDLSTKNGSVMNSIGAHSKPDHIAASYRNLYGDESAKQLNLTPHFANPDSVANMLDGKPNSAALAMKDKNHIGLGDVLHNRMGHSNVDPSITVIAGETSKDDNAKLSSVIQGQQAA